MEVLTSTLLAGDFNRIGDLIVAFLSQWSGVVFGIAGGLALILGASAGIKYLLASRDGDEQKLKQAKEYVKGIIIAIIILVLVAALVPVIVSVFQTWYDNDAQEYLSLEIFDVI